MANTIKTRLNTLKAKLDALQNAVNEGKREIAYAIKFNGVETVNPYTDSSNVFDTFARYAYLIRRLKAANSMVLEFQLTGNVSKIDRSVILPMRFSTTDTPGATLAGIYKEIINSNVPALTESKVLASSKASSKLDMSSLIDDFVNETNGANATEEEESIYTTDYYGNECIRGDYVPSIDDIERFLNDEQIEELTDSLEKVEIETEETTNGSDGLDSFDFITINTSDLFADLSGDNADAMLRANLAATGGTSVANDAVYDFEVDWGDGTSAKFTAGASYEENKAAIWHIYDKLGTYDVTINGNFRTIYTAPSSTTALNDNGSYINDGVRNLTNGNQTMMSSLIEVLSWGNTLLTNMSGAFCYCKKLKQIPMYDTTNSFEDVENFSWVFGRCSGLTSLPFNENTNKGLFTNCKKAKTFASAFYECTGIQTGIPLKLIDGCESVTSLASMFAYAGFKGDIPVGMLAGLTNVTNVSEMFASCALQGELSPDLFKDCPNITTIYRLFYNCTGVTGTIQREFIGGLSKLTDMRQAFHGCSGINGIASDAFYNLSANGINARDAFYGTSITEIPDGLFDGMTGSNLMLEGMFWDCKQLTGVSKTALANLKVANARGMFSGCDKLVSELPNENPDWSDENYIEKWYGLFSGTKLSNKNTTPIELGGTGARRFPNKHVGKIRLKDGTMVETKDYAYDASNPPICWIYADKILEDSKTIPTIANSAGNESLTSGDGKTRYLFGAVFSDTKRQWTDSQLHCEDVTTITNTSDTNVSYNLWSYNGDKQTKRNTRYCGVPYTNALRQFVFEKGYATNVLQGSYKSYSVVTTLPTSSLNATNIYYMKDTSNNLLYKAYVVSGNTLVNNASLDVYINKITSDRYPIIKYVNEYNTGVNVGDCHIMDASEGWDCFTQRYMFKDAIDKIIAGGGFKSDNTVSYRYDTWYWASAEGHSTYSWRVYTANSSVNHGSYKWSSGYVRPALAFAV